ncbi:MAG: histidine kinase dimerization/phospho-acceptor domain-containing protein, partial [Pseudomonadota bacterium]|nr:histidine kinase dimerization/phospho-acceptor domain-containing protein [Pseudomonadota bacterium]
MDEARKEVEFASQAKLDFLAYISHELLTPLNAVIGFSNMTQQTFGPINERNKAYAQDIQNPGENLLALINDVLDISKIKAGEITSY